MVRAPVGVTEAVISFVYITGMVSCLKSRCSRLRLISLQYAPRRMHFIVLIRLTGCPG
jgi:hypothetical protein